MAKQVSVTAPLNSLNMVVKNFIEQKDSITADDIYMTARDASEYTQSTLASAGQARRVDAGYEEKMQAYVEKIGGLPEIKRHTPLSERVDAITEQSRVARPTETKTVRDDAKSIAKSIGAALPEGMKALGGVMAQVPAIQRAVHETEPFSVDGTFNVRYVDITDRRTVRDAVRHLTLTGTVDGRGVRTYDPVDVTQIAEDIEGYTRVTEGPIRNVREHTNTVIELRPVLSEAEQAEDMSEDVSDDATLEPDVNDDDVLIEMTSDGRIVRADRTDDLTGYRLSLPEGYRRSDRLDTVYLTDGAVHRQVVYIERAAEGDLTSYIEHLPSVTDHTFYASLDDTFTDRIMWHIGQLRPLLGPAEDTGRLSVIYQDRSLSGFGRPLTEAAFADHIVRQMVQEILMRRERGEAYGGEPLVQMASADSVTAELTIHGHDELRKDGLSVTLYRHHYDAVIRWN